MAFNSLTFFLFLPLVYAGFRLSPQRLRWAWLLLASIVFYAGFGLANLVFLAAVAGVTYGFGLAMEASGTAARRKQAMALAVTVLIGSLAALKYYDFLAGEFERAFGFEGLPRLQVAAPVGYSFYVFMATAYLVDVYRRTAAAQHHAGRLALFLAWFPKILAGPIERAEPLMPQLRDRLCADPALTVFGLQLILWGLVKKVVIADNLAPFVDRTFSIAAYAAPMDLLISIYFFAFQIYCDFSGYSDIAIGLSLLFGIRLMENFRRPYLSQSVSEFWSDRWHVSLGRWFRDYLYIPLGGSRAGPVRRYLNIMLVFVASGLWHAGLGYGVGWTFLVWGLINGLYIWAGLALGLLRQAVSDRLPDIAGRGLLPPLRIILTFHLILVSWVFFRAESIDQAVLILTRVAKALPSLPGLAPNFPFTADHLFGALLIGSLVIVEAIGERKPIAERIAEAPIVVRWTTYYAGLIALVVLGRWQAEQFIYMQF